MVVEGKHVLVVEREPEMAQLLSAILQSEGFEVEVLTSHNELAKRLEGERPDLVVVDLVPLDFEAGSDLTDLFKGNSGNEGIPVVVISTSSEATRQMAAIKNVRGFVREPFDLGELLAQVRSAVGASGASGDRIAVRSGVLFQTPD